MSRIIPKTFPGKRGPRTYYYEVEDVWNPQKKQSRRKVLRYLGKSPIPPIEPIPLPQVHLGLLATRLATGSLSAQDAFEFVQRMGIELPSISLEALAIHYDFQKKRSELRLYPLTPSDRPPSRAGRPRTSPTPTPHTSEPSRAKAP
ncbi:MAG: hypothetical protein ACREB9_04015 [Thermoplasmata archaeon]